MILQLIKNILSSMWKFYFFLVIVLFGGITGLPNLVSNTLSVPTLLAFKYVVCFLLATFGYAFSARVIYLLYIDRNKCVTCDFSKQDTNSCDLYKQNSVKVITTLENDGSWRILSDIEIEVVCNEDISVINHYNYLASSYNTEFKNYSCVGEIISHPDGKIGLFTYKPKQGNDKSKYDISFEFSRPLVKGDVVRYSYEEKYSDIVPLTMGELINMVRRRATHNQELEIVKGYTILCKTDKLERIIRFPLDYEVNKIHTDVLFRLNHVSHEERRVNEFFTSERKPEYVEVRWVIDNPKKSFDYFIKYSPPEKWSPNK